MLFSTLVRNHGLDRLQLTKEIVKPPVIIKMNFMQLWWSGSKNHGVFAGLSDPKLRQIMERDWWAGKMRNPKIDYHDTKIEDHNTKIDCQVNKIDCQDIKIDFQDTKIENT